jgi:uncharacterized protein (UPF0147 family)
MMTKLADKKIEGVLELIAELQDDSSVPRNVKDKLQSCVNALQEECSFSLRIDKVRHTLEDISEDSNMQSYTRTQIWNISSHLEKL